MRHIACCIQLLAVLAAAGAPGAGAQDIRYRSRAQIDSLLNPPLSADAESIVRPARQTRDIGTLTEDDAPLACRFVLTNVSGKPIEVRQVRITCGCLKAEYPKGTVTPRGTQEITLTYVPRNHPGSVDADAFVYVAGGGDTPVARLTLTGNVLPGADEWARYPYAAGKLRMKRKSIEVRFAAEAKVTERILCANSGGRPLRLSARLMPAFARFRTEPEVIPPGCEGDIVITVEKALLPQGKGDSFSFPIVVEGVEGKPSDRTITVSVTITDH